MMKQVDISKPPQESPQRSFCHQWIVDGRISLDKPLDSAILSHLKQLSETNKLKKMDLHHGLYKPVQMNSVLRPVLKNGISPQKRRFLLSHLGRMIQKRVQALLALPLLPEMFLHQNPWHRFQLCY
ncbi:hypothetical protein NC653_041239 [Populus alba x Populus x berolinensis]|uniref:Uncharacterized protein n=1 Tax=Populus alba x Populus x berolinensis TaxID=444605 RepID=A0AAD6L807_9ROSI|nr:hypothetical protein NC653_041239 [Populus alba x Populus x berolinensis]